MSKELEKMNIISIVQKLKEDDVIILQKYIENLEKENEKLQHYKTLYQSLKRQKDKAVEYIEKHLTDNGRFLMLNEWQVPDLLRILKEVE